MPNERQSRANERRSRTDEDQSRTDERQSRTDERRSRTDEDRSRADGGHDPVAASRAGRTRDRNDRGLRADARDNRERILRAAKAEFTEQGSQASLNRIAQRAGVGAGTLYRNFPNLQTLLVAIIASDVDALCASGQALLAHEAPEDALRSWLRAVAMHATAMRGLVAIEMAAISSEALAGCHDAIIATGTALLDRAQRAGGVAKQVHIADLLALVNAAAWASEQAENPQLLGRLLGLIDRCLHP